jgi:PAS domain S-box-containing protein
VFLDEESGPSPSTGRFSRILASDVVLRLGGLMMQSTSRGRVSSDPERRGTLDHRTAEDIRLQLAAIVDSSNDAIIAKDLDGVISTWNLAAQRLFGYSEAEAIGQSITLIIPPDLHDEEKDILRRVRIGERIEHYETRRVTRDGRTLDVSITISPVRDATGAIVGASKILRDVTEVKLARAALRDSIERFRLIADTAPVIVWMSDASKACTYLNQTWLNLTGQPADAALGTGWKDHIHPDDVDQCWDIFASAVDRRAPFQMDFRLRRYDGDYRSMVSTGAPQYNGDGSFAGYIGFAIDVTERRQAAEALATINQRLFDAQEEERSRIARELHDDIGQRLAVLSLDLEALARVSGVPDTEGRQKIGDARRDVMSIAAGVQSLSHRLHPARLEYLGIAAAAETLCREVSRQRALEVAFHAESVPDGVSRRVAVCLYRVLQEALQNAVKHSGMGTIDVTLRGGVDEIELTVRDFGAGFEVSTTQGRGLGLTSMKERVSAVGGCLTIVSAPQHGTTILATVPLVKGDPNEASESQSA